MCTDIDSQTLPTYKYSIILKKIQGYDRYCPGYSATDLVSIYGFERMVENVYICSGVPRLQHGGMHGRQRRGHIVVTEVTEPRCSGGVGE